jgi:hypothetical protein
LIKPHTIGEREKGRCSSKITVLEREARSIGMSSVFEDDGKKMRDKGVEMIGGFESEKVKKLLLCGTLRASSDDT